MPEWLWKRWWMTARRLEGRIKFGNIETDLMVLKEGVNQGDVSAAEEWGYYFQDMADKLQEVPDDQIVTIKTRGGGDQLIYMWMMRVFWCGSRRSNLRQ